MYYTCRLHHDTYLLKKRSVPPSFVSHVDSQGSLEFRDWTAKSPRRRERNKGTIREYFSRSKKARAWQIVVAPSIIPPFIFLFLFSSLSPLSSSSYRAALDTFPCVRAASLEGTSAAPSWLASSTSRPWEYHADKHQARNCDTSAGVQQLTPDIPLRGRRMRRF